MLDDTPCTNRTNAEIYKGTIRVGGKMFAQASHSTSIKEAVSWFKKQIEERCNVLQLSDRLRKIEIQFGCIFDAVFKTGHEHRLLGGLARLKKFRHVTITGVPEQYAADLERIMRKKGTRLTKYLGEGSEACALQQSRSDLSITEVSSLSHVGVQGTRNRQTAG